LGESRKAGDLSYSGVLLNRPQIFGVGAKHDRIKSLFFNPEISAGMLRPYRYLWLTNLKTAVTKNNPKNNDG
jgi:hypothetical protein